MTRWHWVSTLAVALVLLAAVAVAAERRRRRRWGFWQISLREGIVVLLVLGGLAAWAAYLRSRTSSQLETLARFSGEGTLFIEYWDTEPNWFTEIFDPRGFRSEKPVVGDVVQIELTSNQISAEQLAKLAPLQRLQSLAVGGDVDTAGLAHLADLPNLRLLAILNSDLDDDALLQVGRLEQVEYLELRYSRFTNAGLAHLRSLRRLLWLDLARTPITDAGVAHIQALTQLESLDLSNTAVTDTGVMHLRGLKRLEHLDVTNTQVTADGVERLQRSLPELEIVH